MNPIWRVTREMSKNRSETLKQTKRQREILREKTRKEKERRRMEALERDRQRFIVGQEQNVDELDKDEEQEQESAAERFQKELCWCIQQTRLGLTNIKPTSNDEHQPQAEEAHKLLRILTSPKAPMAKKRQVMRATFGDYRSKMQQEERRHKADMNKRMILEAASRTKQDSSTFYRVASLSAATVPLSTRQKDHPGSPVDNKEVDQPMQELQQSTISLCLVSTDTTVRPNHDDDNENGHLDEGTASVTPNVNGLFSFNFDISEENLDHCSGRDGSDAQLRGSHRNADISSHSESSTPEKGHVGGGRRKQGSRRRNRAKKKLALKERDASTVVADNQKLSQLEPTCTDFKFDFPEPSIHQSDEP